MTDPTDQAPARLRPGIVLRVREDDCDVLGPGEARRVRYAAVFPTPRTERVSPGHLVALATAPDGADVVLWRWYDAVVLGTEDGLVRLWEPGHGEVLARPRDDRPHRPGTRAYLSAGLPGADWWVAGPVVDRPGDARVELAEVGRFATAHGLWDRLG